ncbi:MAG: hypothetical protein JSS42_04950, partial [Proteobacteria bacterium]|nr:hypothetical protein [Pseudomonadota bacterium]
MENSRPPFLICQRKVHPLRCCAAVSAPKSGIITPFLSHSACRLGGPFAMSIENLRNIAIVAHVDHGKTTLVD